MDKARFYQITIGALLLINLFLVYSIVSGKKKVHKGPPRHEPKHIVIKKLNLDETQIKEYEILIEEHREGVQSLDRKIVETKRQLYNNLTNQTNDQQDLLLSNIADYQKEIERIHYKHFQDIKALCKDEQQEKFNDLTKELGKLFHKKRPRR